MTNLTATQLAQMLHPVQVVPQQPNPSNLLPQYLSSVGGQPVTPAQAIDNWSTNPFILDTPQWTQYNGLRRERQQSAAKQYLKLPDVPVIRAPSKRRISQPRLKFPFETLHDVHLRLISTVIFVGQRLYYVRDAYEYEDDYLLILQDNRGENFKVFYKASGDVDLRTPEPQYFATESVPAFLLRVPFRQQRQGLSNETIQVKYVGETSVRRGDINTLMGGLCPDYLTWAPNYYDLMVRAKAIRALRMSKDIAFHVVDNNLHAEYRGRPLGEVHDDSIVVDKDDGCKSWIKRDIETIGCSMVMK